MTATTREYKCRVRVSKDPIANLRFKIRHNLVADLDKSKKKLKVMEQATT